MSALPEPGGVEPGGVVPEHPSSGLLGAQRDESPGRNLAATVGLILGAVSVLVNPVLLIGLAAIGVSAFGYNRASLMSQFGYAPVGRRKAVLGIALGLVGVVVSVKLKGSLY